MGESRHDLKLSVTYPPAGRLAGVHWHELSTLLPELARRRPPACPPSGASLAPPSRCVARAQVAVAARAGGSAGGRCLAPSGWRSGPAQVDLGWRSLGPHGPPPRVPAPLRTRSSRSSCKRCGLCVAPVGAPRAVTATASPCKRCGFSRASWSRGVDIDTIDVLFNYIVSYW